MRSNILIARDDTHIEESPAAAPGAAPEVADLLVAYLAQLGVEYVFGVPGGAIEPIFNALARSQKRGGPRPIVARHEAGAAFMADGYTRETGKLGVCCATSGPGATNLITGVATACDNGIPLLVLTGQPPLPVLGRRALQESACTGIDTLGMFHHCTRYNSMITHPAQLQPKLIAALMRAMHTPRGPAHLTIPLDVQKSPAPPAAPAYDLRGMLRPAALIDENAVELLHQLVAEARRIVLLIGGGCGEGSASILQFATLLDIPVIATPDGKGLVDPRHPQFRGVFGFAGHAAADAILRDQAVDLILAAGASMGEWASCGWSEALLNERLVHVDEADDHLARSPMARLHVRGRIKMVFDRLLARLQAGGAAAAKSRIARAGAWHVAQAVAEPEKYVGQATPITPQRLMYDLGRLFPPSTRFLADAGNSTAWAIHYLQPEGRRVAATGGGWLRVTMDFAPMGWAIGGAVGTAAGCRGAPVVCITGDGSMLMNGQEMSVAVAERLTVIYVVLNDGALGMVKHGQRLAGAERIGFELPATDFAALARALGAQAHTIRATADLEALDIDAICSRQGPTLLDVHIDPEQVPPMNLRMRALGTAL